MLSMRFAGRSFLGGLIAALASAAALLHVAAVPAHACTCLQSPPPAEALERAAAVFAGRVIAMERDGRERDLHAEYPVRFAVATAWKGVHEREVVVRTSVSTALCGYPFQVGEDYVVYADGEPGALRVSLCSRTVPERHAADDRAALGEGRPGAELPEPRAAAGRAWLWGGLIAVGVGVLARVAR
jgi:hypothetical protein